MQTNKERREALEKFIKSVEFGKAIIDAQMLECEMFLIYECGEWKATNEQSVINAHPEAMRLTAIGEDEYARLTPAYLDDQPGSFEAAWQGSIAQSYSAERSLMLFEKMAAQRIISVQWQPEGATEKARHFYHKDCYEKMQVILPEGEISEVARKDVPAHEQCKSCNWYINF